VTFDDPSSFVSNANASVALQQAIAAVLDGIAGHMITINSLSQNRRLVEEDAWVLMSPTGTPKKRWPQRRLTSGTVDANYNINVPAGVTVPTTSTLQSAQSSMNTQLNTAMANHGMSSITAQGVVASALSTVTTTKFQGSANNGFQAGVTSLTLAVLGLPLLSLGGSSLLK
jgi:hypothetical protein